MRADCHDGVRVSFVCDVCPTDTWLNLCSIEDWEIKIKIGG